MHFFRLLTGCLQVVTRAAMVMDFVFHRHREKKIMDRMGKIRRRRHSNPKQVTTYHVLLRAQ